MEKIPAPQFDRIEAERCGDFVHVALHREDGLRRSEAAKRAVRNEIRRPGTRADAHIGAEIGAGGVQRGTREHRGRKRGVCAAIGVEMDLHRQQLAILVERSAMAHARGMALGGDRQILHAVVDHLHRMTALPGQSAAWQARTEG